MKFSYLVGRACALHRNDYRKEIAGVNRKGTVLTTAAATGIAAQLVAWKFPWASDKKIGRQITAYPYAIRDEAFRREMSVLPWPHPIVGGQH
jgi:hypothetical protein